MPAPDEVTKAAAWSVCPACGRPEFRCAECNKTYFPNRKDSLTCSTRCRVARHRRLQKMEAKVARLGQEETSP